MSITMHSMSVPIMTQRAARPVVQSLTRPVSCAMRMRRVVVLPSPPAPFLLILAFIDLTVFLPFSLTRKSVLMPSRTERSASSNAA